MTDTQTCNTCKLDLSVDNFYLQDGFRLFKKCKKCISDSKPKNPKLTGFGQLPLATQDAIKEALKDRKQKMKDIAKAYDLKYPTLCYWVRNNKIC